MNKKELNNYQGIAVNDLVYIQRHGIGDFEKVKIYKIEVTYKGAVVLYFKAKGTHGDSHSEWKRNQFYTSLEELKFDWILKINLITEDGR